MRFLDLMTELVVAKYICQSSIFGLLFNKSVLFSHFASADILTFLETFILFFPRFIPHPGLIMDPSRLPGGLHYTTVGDASTHHDLSESSKLAKAKHEETMRQIQILKATREITVPVNDYDVRLRLRTLGEPITLFGERAPDRRERLREHMARLLVDNKLDEFNAQFTTLKKQTTVQADPTGEKPYLAEATNPIELASSRLRLLESSLRRSAHRVQKERTWREGLGLLPSSASTSAQETYFGEGSTPVSETVQANRHAFEDDYAWECAKIKKFVPISSQVADTRVVSGVTVTRDASLLATCSWSGTAKVWDSTGANGPLFALKGHVDRIQDICFIPGAWGHAFSGSDMKDQEKDVMEDRNMDNSGDMEDDTRKGIVDEAGITHFSEKQIRNFSDWNLPVSQRRITEANILTAGVEGVGVWPLHGRLVDVAGEYGTESKEEEEETRKQSFVGVEIEGADLDVMGDEEPNTATTETNGTKTEKNDKIATVSSGISQVLQEKRKNRLPTVAPLAMIPMPSRVNRVAATPCGGFALATTHNLSFAYIDLETTRTVLQQFGHSAATYGLAVHPDGSIAAVGDIGANARLWDLRSGRALTALEGHAGQVLGCDFGPGPYAHMLATASGDHTVRLWDLRMRKCLYTIPAQNHMVSDVKFHPSGDLLLTTGYDGVTNIFNTLNYSRVARLAAMGSKVMRASWIGADKLATANFDCALRVWGHENA